MASLMAGCGGMVGQWPTATATATATTAMAMAMDMDILTAMEITITGLTRIAGEQGISAPLAVAV